MQGGQKNREHDDCLSMEGSSLKCWSESCVGSIVLPKGRRRPWDQKAQSVEQSCDPKAYVESGFKKEFHMGSMGALLSPQGTVYVECKNALKADMGLEENFTEQGVE